MMAWHYHLMRFYFYHHQDRGATSPGASTNLFFKVLFEVGGQENKEMYHINVIR